MNRFCQDILNNIKFLNFELYIFTEKSIFLIFIVKAFFIVNIIILITYLFLAFKFARHKKIRFLFSNDLKFIKIILFINKNIFLL